MPDDAVELGRWRKPNGDQIVLRRNHFNGRTFVDLRVFCPDTTAGPGVPTKAGLCFSPDLWAEILEALAAEVKAGAA